MHKLNEKGSLVIPLVLVSVLFLTAAIFGFWAFAGRQDYKNNVDKKIAEAVEVAEANLSTKKDAEFAEAEKSPFKTYQGPTTFGTANIVYPKTWSAYIDESGKGSSPVVGYFHPNFVPATDQDTAFALRFEVVNTAYDAVSKTYDSYVKSGRVTAAAYRAPKVDGVLGMRIEGEITPKKQGVMVLLPLRDKTIKLWTEGQEFRADYQAILDSFSFIP